jgi:hypothetical protein
METGDMISPESGSHTKGFAPAGTVRLARCVEEVRRVSRSNAAVSDSISQSRAMSGWRERPSHSEVVSHSVRRESGSDWEKRGSGRRRRRRYRGFMRRLLHRDTQGCTEIHREKSEPAETPDPGFQDLFVEIDQKPKFLPRKFEVSQDLRFMHRKKLVNGLKLYNHQVVHQNIYAKSQLKPGLLVVYRHRFLPLSHQPRLYKLIAKALFIH